jgi:parvulin-like peptidyl-prolyl isomerase
MAAKADKLSPDAQDYWKLQFQLQAVKKDFIFKREQSEVTMPNAKRLVEEYYKTKKDKYAKVPELRASSHILLASPPGQPRDGVRARAQKLLDELRAGADFKEYVATYSEDPGSKARGGALQSWMRRGDPNFTPPYSEALFDIESVGGYSEITDSPFGIHIIRLDGIKEASYKDFDEVKAEIFEDIVADYRSLVAKEVAARYNISDDAFVDGAAMDQLFSPVTPP